MKKLIALLLMLFYSTTNSCFAFSALYYLKNVQTADVQPIVETGYDTNRFILSKQNPYYGVSQAGDDYAVIILQQSGNNLFYYYQSESTKVNKTIVRELKKQNIVYEQSFNQDLIDIYDNLAKDVMSTNTTTKTYSFEEPQNAFAPPKDGEVQTINQGTLRGSVVQLTAGTKFQAYLQNAINTATASKGDQIVAVLSSNLSYNGATIAPQGSLVYGTLSKARNASYGSRNGRVVISFNQIVTPENKVYNISAEDIDFTVSNEGKIKESAKNAVSSAAAGAIVGLLFGLLSGSDHALRSAAIGAGVGAGSSVIYSTAEKGVDAEIPSFTELEITLSKPISVSVSY